MIVLKENENMDPKVKNLENWFNSLIGGEINAAIQYEIASKIVEGTDYDACASEFQSHADEEWEHAKKLMDAAVERDLSIEKDIPCLVNCSKPAYEPMKCCCSDYLVEFNFKNEESAINAYREFFNLIKCSDPVLSDLIKEILDEEIEHRKDLKKMYSSIKGASEC